MTQKGPERVRKGFGNGSKTVPKQFPTRFGTVFEPFRNLSRTVFISEPLPSARAGKLGGAVFDLCVTFSFEGNFPTCCRPIFDRCSDPLRFWGRLRGLCSTPPPANRLSKFFKFSMHVHTPIPLFYKKGCGKGSPSRSKPQVHHVTAWGLRLPANLKRVLCQMAPWQTQFFLKRWWFFFTVFRFQKSLYHNVGSLVPANFAVRSFEGNFASSNQISAKLARNTHGAHLRFASACLHCRLPNFCINAELHFFEGMRSDCHAKKIVDNWPAILLILYVLSFGLVHARKKLKP